MGLVIGITFLFVVSAMTPIIGYDVRGTEREQREENYVFDRFEEGSQSKSSEYKKRIHLDNPKNDHHLDANMEDKLLKNLISDGLMDSPWPMYCHDTRHTGQSRYSTAENLGGEKWMFRAEIGIDSSPAIDQNGIIYVGSNEHFLHAIYPNGTEKWRFDCLFLVTSSPAIADDGTIYVGSWNGRLYAVNPNGTKKWEFGAQHIRSSPAIGEDGTIYFGTLAGDQGKLYAINPNGTEKWHFDISDLVYSSPAIGDDGTIYITSNDRNLYAFYPNGTVNWTFRLGDLCGSPSIVDDGTIYVACWDGDLYAVYSNGALKWTSGIGWGSGKTPSITEDGTIYVGGDELYAINPDGSRKWAFDPGEGFDVTSSANAISYDGTIYIGVSKGTGEGGYIIAVNPDGTEKWRNWIHNERVWSSPAIGSDGTIYIGSTSGPVPYGYLWAFNGVIFDKPVIEKPEQGNLYIFNNKRRPTLFGNTVIIGKINVEVQPFYEENVSKVEFYIDDVKQYEDSSPPFEWMWDEITFFKHKLKVMAYYNEGFNRTTQVNVWKFF